MRQVGTSAHRQQLAGACVFAFSFVLLGLLFFAGSSAAAETHLFNATLSLTGDCSTSAADPVPDPGCPGIPGPPAGPFAEPSGIATDPAGDIYVASAGAFGNNGTDGRVDVFDPTGHFMTEVAVRGPRAIAVDPSGNLYVSSYGPGAETVVLRFEPTEFEPEAGRIEYGSPPTTVLSESSTSFLVSDNGLAVDAEGHLFVGLFDRVGEYGSAAEGNALIDDTIGVGTCNRCSWVAVDPANEEIFVSNSLTADASSASVIDVFAEGPGHELIRTIDGSTTPAGGFKSTQGLASVAIDTEDDHIFVDDRESPSAKKPVYELTKTGEFVGVIEHGFEYSLPSSIWVDNGVSSPNRGYLFVPSGVKGTGHSFAFEPLPEVVPPTIESLTVDSVDTSEAVFRAILNPGGVTADYRFEFTTQANFEAFGFGAAAVAGTGEIGPSSEGIPVGAVAAGLVPGTAYRFRVVVENACGGSGCHAETEGTFSTYPSTVPEVACPNQGSRTGNSASLPDCRAYELVTPPDTNGHPPYTVAFGGEGFASPTATGDGNSVAFSVIGGAIPGTGAAGAALGDPYNATRSATGWAVTSAGPSGSESESGETGGVSGDHAYLFWRTGNEDEGSAVVGGRRTTYVRGPDGKSTLIGRGSLGTDPRAIGLAISEGGGHVLFRTTDSSIGQAVRLERAAPPTGTGAIYDRTGDGVTHVVSLLPGDQTPAAGEDASFLGASANGNSVAFEVGRGSPLFVRVGNSRTIEAAAPGSVFEGFSADGTYLFFLRAGELFRYALGPETVAPFSSGEGVTVVNVSADGTRAYFTSTSALPGTGPNPNRERPVAGGQNLYVTDGVATRFVAGLTERDVNGELPVGSGELIDGLGLWASAVGPGKLAIDPSRTNQDGSVILFESRARLTAYDPGPPAGEDFPAEIYLYMNAPRQLICLSCSPTGAAPAGAASLQSVGTSVGGSNPTSPFAIVANLASDGKRAFFQTPTPLVASDSDGVQDVYEWEEDGVGGCGEVGGCTSLVSSGQSARPNYLFGASSSGDDVFFSTSDQLVRADADGTASIYDARRFGGFAEAEATPCQGEACRPTLTAAPDLSSPASPASTGSGNVSPKPRCGKGKRLVTRKGKSRCVKPKHKKKHKKHQRHERRPAAKHQRQGGGR